MGRVYAELVQIRLERGSSEASAMASWFFFFFSASLFCTVDLNALDVRYDLNVSSQKKERANAFVVG